MRFLFVLCLGLFSAFAFSQDSISNEKTPPTTTTADASSAANSTSESGQAPIPAQRTSPSTNLGDAPSTTQRTTCTENNGKPCPEWVHRLIGQYPPVKEVSEHRNRQPDHFFTLGNAQRALHPDKKSWMLFTLAHAGMWASTVVAVRNHQTTMEEAHSEYPAVAFMTGMDFMFFKTVSPSISVLPPVYAMIHYSKVTAK
jgi:hypothetical protein